jgi:hypothetical protein
LPDNVVQFLSLDEAIAIHERLIDKFGGTPGLRDRGLLELIAGSSKSIQTMDTLLSSARLRTTGATTTTWYRGFGSTWKNSSKTLFKMLDL